MLPQRLKKTGDATLKTAAKEVDKLPGGITYFFDGEQSWS